MPTVDLTGVSVVALAPLLLSLGVGTLVSLLLAWHFNRLSASLANHQELSRTFPFLLLTTILIVSVVKSSVALSLGLVGALSIVRFRTPVKEPEELAYLFLAIGVGVGLGAGQITITLIAAAFILGLTALLSARTNPARDAGMYLVVNWSERDGTDTDTFERVRTIVRLHGPRGELKRLDARQGSIEATYFVKEFDQQNLPVLLKDLRLAGSLGVTILDESRFPDPA